MKKLLLSLALVLASSLAHAAEPIMIGETDVVEAFGVNADGTVLVTLKAGTKMHLVVNADNQIMVEDFNGQSHFTLQVPKNQKISISLSGAYARSTY
jgi:hypothetical protein